MLIASLDDAGVADNHFEVRATTAAVFVDVLLIALTARLNDNRLNQSSPVASAGSISRLSAMVLGASALADANVGTSCIVVNALVAAWRVEANNVVLAALGDPRACLAANRVGASLGSAIAYYLLTK